MKLQAITDWHLGSPAALGTMEDFKKLLLEKLKIGSVYLLGDNFDFANMLIEDIPEYQIFYKYILSLPNVYELKGNHERMTTVDEFFVVGKVLLKHLDFEFWGSEKAIAYRSKPMGASAFKRKFIIPMIESYEEDRTPKLKKDFLIRAAQSAKEKDCSIIIGGHKHPSETIDIIHDGIRIVVLKRGFSVIENC